MPKMKKVDLLKELDRMGISYDDTYSYNDLYRLYKLNKKTEYINSKYEYVPSDGEKLITDIPSSGLDVI
jgi:hypothetical protein